MLWDDEPTTAITGDKTPSVGSVTYKDSKYDYNNVIVSYEKQTFTVTKAKDKANIDTKVKTPKIEWKQGEDTYDDSGKTYKYSINGAEEQEITTLGTDEITLKSEVSLAKLEATAKAGQEYITDKFNIVINLYDEDIDDGDTPAASATFTINVQIKISDATFTVGTDQKWNNAIYELMKGTPAEVPATPTEENKTTEENKKDDVPKTGEVIYI